MLPVQLNLASSVQLAGVLPHCVSHANVPFFPSIIALLTSCRPTAISRLVVAVVVDTIKGGSLRPWSHISKEGRKVILPSLAHHNSSSTVVFVLFASWVKAALFHRVVGDVFRRQAAGGRVPMLDVSSGQMFSHQTSATSHRASSQMVASNGTNSAAFASALPPNEWAFYGARYDSQPTVYDAIQVLDLRHVSL